MFFKQSKKIKQMPRGGSRDGAGRKLGGANKIDAEARARALEGGISPLDYMLSMMRDTTQEYAIRNDMAKAAAPYVHSRLASIEHSGSMTLHHEDALDELDDEPTGTEDTDTPQG